MSAWISVIGAALSALVLALKLYLKRDDKAKERADAAEKNESDLKEFAGKNLNRENEHEKRVENILSGVTRIDAGRMLSTYPTPDRLPKAGKARPKGN